jgi:NADH-quinone oxidoreductase subunit J
MIVTILFGLLAAIAILGACGVLLCRRVLHCGLSFLLCSAALSGLFLLLDVHFLAATQFAIGVCLTGMMISIITSAHNAEAHPGFTLPYAAGGALFLALALWAIVKGQMGEPVLSSLPMWATRGDHISALGRELVGRYSLPFVLFGLLLLVSIVSAVHLHRSDGFPKGREQGE